MIKKGLYQHFKGNYYKVLGLSRHSETQEELVVYQPLYGDRGLWVRPLEMFSQVIERDGKRIPRFGYCENQTEVLEVALLDVVPSRESDFESTFTEAQTIIASMQGYISHRLERCIETPNRYVLLVEWQTLEDHTIGFRKSSEYQTWKSLLHDFYHPFPTVEHFRARA